MFRFDVVFSLFLKKHIMTFPNGIQRELEFVNDRLITPIDKNCYATYVPKFEDLHGEENDFGNQQVKNKNLKNLKKLEKKDSVNAFSQSFLIVDVCSTNQTTPLFEFGLFKINKQAITYIITFNNKRAFVQNTNYKKRGLL